jgi:hypothetical protein
MFSSAGIVYGGHTSHAQNEIDPFAILGNPQYDFLVWCPGQNKRIASPSYFN